MTHIFSFIVNWPHSWDKAILDSDFDVIYINPGSQNLGTRVDVIRRYGTVLYASVLLYTPK